jgi:transposase
MAIVGGFDVHRSQITVELLDTESGELRRGQIRPATREALRRWLSRFHPEQEVAIALEATTGWRFVVEELVRAGVEPHLAEPADTSALRGRKKRAKTDRQDAKHLRELLQQGRLPECWIPPTQLQELRELVRLRKDLHDDRRRWVQRIHAEMFQQGLPSRAGHLDVGELADLELSPAGQRKVEVARRRIEETDRELEQLDRELLGWARRSVAVRVLRSRFGWGPITSLCVVAEHGDARRFSSSRKAVRNTGLDITIYQSDDKRAPGRLSRQGPSVLRWALFEIAVNASRSSSPAHAYYLQVKERKGHLRAVLSQARREMRWAHHTLIGLGDSALEFAA